MDYANLARTVSMPIAIFSYDHWFRQQNEELKEFRWLGYQASQNPEIIESIKTKKQFREFLNRTGSDAVVNPGSRGGLLSEGFYTLFPTFRPDLIPKTENSLFNRIHKNEEKKENKDRAQFIWGIGHYYDLIQKTVSVGLTYLASRQFPEQSLAQFLPRQEVITTIFAQTTAPLAVQFSRVTTAIAPHFFRLTAPVAPHMLEAIKTITPLFSRSTAALAQIPFMQAASRVYASNLFMALPIALKVLEWALQYYEIETETQSPHLKKLHTAIHSLNQFVSILFQIRIGLFAFYQLTGSFNLQTPLFSQSTWNTVTLKNITLLLTSILSWRSAYLTIKSSQKAPDYKKLEKLVNEIDKLNLDNLCADTFTKSISAAKSTIREIDMKNLQDELYLKAVLLLLDSTPPSPTLDSSSVSNGDVKDLIDTLTKVRTNLDELDLNHIPDSKEIPELKNKHKDMATKKAVEDYLFYIAGKTLLSDPEDGDIKRRIKEHLESSELSAENKTKCETLLNLLGDTYDKLVQRTGLESNEFHNLNCK